MKQQTMSHNTCQVDRKKGNRCAATWQVAVLAAAAYFLCLSYSGVLQQLLEKHAAMPELQKSDTVSMIHLPLL
jgi:hypothetical protein